MKQHTGTVVRFAWMQKIAIVILCLYYYVSLFRPSNSVLGLDVVQIAKVLLWLFFIFVIIQLIFNFHLGYNLYKHTRIRFIIVTSCTIVFTILSQQSWLLIPFLLYLSFNSTGLEALAKQLFIVSTICYIAVIVLGIAIPDLGREAVDKSYSIASIVGTSANSLGFPNSNSPLLYFTMIAMNGAFLFTTRSERKRYSLVMLVIATILFILTLSITGYICILIFLSVYAFSSTSLLKVVRLAIPVIVISALLMTPFIALRYGQNDTNTVNSTLSNRPHLWYLRVSEGSYQNIIGNSDNYRANNDEAKTGYTLDNQYLLLISRYGWVALLIILYLYFTGLRQITHPAILSGLLASSIYFVAESIMFVMVLNIVTVVAIGNKIYSKPGIEIGSSYG